MLKFDEPKGLLVVFAFMCYLAILSFLVVKAKAEVVTFSWILGVIFYKIFDIFILFKVTSAYRNVTKIITFIIMFFSMLLLKIATQ